MTLDEFLEGLNPQQTMRFENAPLLEGLESTSVPHQLNDYDVPTIGFGHTQGVEPGMEIDREQATELFQDDFRQAAGSVLADLPQDVLGQLGPRAQQALVDVAFNAGPISQVAPIAHQALLDGDFDTAAHELFDREAGVTKVNGEIIEGLVNRRAANREDFDADRPFEQPARAYIDPFLIAAVQNQGWGVSGGIPPRTWQAAAPLPIDMQAIVRGARQGADPNSFQSQLRASIENLQASGMKFVELLGESFGIESLEEFGRQGVIENEQAAARYGIPDINSIDDFEELGFDRESAEDVGKFIQFAFAQGIPSLVMGGGSAAVGALLGSAAGPAGTVAGGILGAFLSSYVTNTGELAREIEEKGGSSAEERVALAIGVPLAGLDAAGLGKILKPVAGPLIKEFGIEPVVKELATMGVKRKIAQEAIEGFATEAATESLQEGIIMYSAGALTGTPIDPDEFNERVLTAAAIGGLVGGPAAGLNAGAGAIIESDAAKQAQATIDSMKAELEKSGVEGDEAFRQWFDSASDEEIQRVALKASNYSLTSVKNINSQYGRAFGAGAVLMDAFGGKGISPLDAWAKDSESMDILRNTIVHRDGPDTPVGFDIFERVERLTGTWLAKLEAARRIAGEKEFSEGILDTLRGINVPEAGTNLDQATKDTRALFNEIFDKGREVGIEVGYTEDFVPRLFNKVLLTQSQEAREAFTKLARDYGFTDNQIQNTLSKITKGHGVINAHTLLNPDRFDSEQELRQALTEGSAFGIQRPAVIEGLSRKASLENARALAFIPDEALAPFLVQDPETVLREYVISAAKQITKAEAFGPRETKLKEMLYRAAEELDAAGNPLNQQGINRIYNMIDAFDGIYKPILNPTFRKINNSLTSYNYMNLLGLSTLSTLQEPLIAFEQLGGEGSNFGKAIGTAIATGTKQRLQKVFKWGKRGKEAFTPEEFQQDLLDFGWATDYGTAARLRATFGGEAQAEPALDRTERFLQKSTNVFFQANLLAPVTKLFRSISYASGLKMVESRAQRLAEGQAPVGSARWQQWTEEMNALGLDPAELVAWHNRGADKSDPYWQTNAKYAAARFVNGVVMHPTPANRPMWMNNPHFQLISQLKGFQTVFGNTVMKRWFKKIVGNGVQRGLRNSVGIAATGMMMMTVAAMMNHLREMLTYWDEEGNPRHKGESDIEMVFRAARRSGFLGSIEFAAEAAGSYKFGADPLGTILGPTVASAVGLAQGAARIALGDSPDQLRTQVIKQIPGLSLSPALREAMREQLKDVGL